MAGGEEGGVGGSMEEDSSLGETRELHECLLIPSEFTVHMSGEFPRDRVIPTPVCQKCHNNFQIYCNVCICHSNNFIYQGSSQSSKVSQWGGGGGGDLL